MLTTSQIRTYHCALGTITHTNCKLTSALLRRITTAIEWLRHSVEVLPNPAYAVSLDVDMLGPDSSIDVARALPSDLYKMIRSRNHTPDHFDGSLPLTIDCAASRSLVFLSSCAEHGSLSVADDYSLPAHELCEPEKSVLAALTRNVNFSASASENISGRYHGSCESHHAPMVALTCCADHRVSDENPGQKFFASVGSILESLLLPNELVKAIELRRNNLPGLAVPVN